MIKLHPPILNELPAADDMSWRIRMIKCIDAIVECSRRVTSFATWIDLNGYYNGAIQLITDSLTELSSHHHYMCINLFPRGVLEHGELPGKLKLPARLRTRSQKPKFPINRSQKS